MAKKRWGVVANESLAFLRHLAFLRQENARGAGGVDRQGRFGGIIIEVGPMLTGHCRPVAAAEL